MRSAPIRTGSRSSRTPSSDLTPDQQKPRPPTSNATAESPTSMDRLLCGDVGYGKTEVRCAPRSGRDGRQAGRVPSADDGPRQHQKTLAIGSPGSRPDRMIAASGRRPNRSRCRRWPPEGGDHRRHAPAASKDPVPRLRPSRRRRGAAVRRRAQGRIKQIQRVMLTMTATPIPRTVSCPQRHPRRSPETPPKDRLSSRPTLARPAVISGRFARAGTRRQVLRAQPGRVHFLVGNP